MVPWGLQVQLAAGITAMAILGATLSPSEHWWLMELGEKVGKPLGGEGVVVAVIDTGIDVTHPDLESTVIGGADFSRVGTPKGTTPVGSSGYHGTMVASLIAGQGLESGGIIGVAPGAKLLSVSVGLGVDSSDTYAQIAAAIIWSVDAGANVINLSFSRDSSSWPISWDSAFLYAFENDVVIVAASGNDSDGNYRPASPATIPGVISVTGLNKDLEATLLSGTTGLDVTLSAPGAGVFGSYPGDQIAGWSGSSAATPIVSGVVALMRAQDPKASANDIVFRMINTTRDLGEPGFDEVYGFGMVTQQPPSHRHDGNDKPTWLAELLGRSLSSIRNSGARRFKSCNPNCTREFCGCAGRAKLFSIASFPSAVVLKSATLCTYNARGTVALVGTAQKAQ